MQKPDRIDFDKLLGFELVTRELCDGLDFKSDIFGAKLGAKVGDPESGSATRKIEFSRLLGFDTITDELGKGCDFQGTALGDKLGAKVGGGVEPTAPAGIDFQSEALGARLGAKVGDPETSG